MSAERSALHPAPSTFAPARPAWPVETDFQRPVYCIMGLPFDAVSLREAAAIVDQAASKRERCFFSTPNLNFVIGCQNDPAFRESVLRSNLSVADGMPLVWVARAMGLPLRERVAGSSIFEELRRSRKPPMSAYLFGGPPGVAEQACSRLNAAAKGVVCAGWDTPGYGTVEDLSTPDTIDAINAAGADFLVVALGAKKGQLWILENADALNVPVISHLGAVINFVAGTVSRAPARWQRLGLEWFWRIRQEPLLWQRYAKDGSRFLWMLLTNVILTVVDSRRHSPSDEALAAATVAYAVDEEPSGGAGNDGPPTLVEIRGDWNVKNLSALRTAFTEVSRLRRDIVIDVGSIGYFDSACVALLLLLRGHQGKAGKTLKLRSVSSTTRRRMALYGVDFLDIRG